MVIGSLKLEVEGGSGNEQEAWRFTVEGGIPWTREAKMARGIIETNMIL